MGNLERKNTINILKYETFLKFKTTCLKYNLILIFLFQNNYKNKKGKFRKEQHDKLLFYEV